VEQGRWAGDPWPGQQACGRVLAVYAGADMTSLILFAPLVAAWLFAGFIHFYTPMPFWVAAICFAVAAVLTVILLLIWLQAMTMGRRE